MTTQPVTLTLAAFLSARLDDDEAAARAATPGPWQVVPSYGRAGLERAPRPGTTTRGPVPADPLTWSEDGDVLLVEDAAHIARHDPARVLADVEAKRKLLDLHEGDHECEECLDAWDEGTTEGRVYGGSVAAGSMVRDGVRLAGCQTLRLLALPYRDHDQYDPAWRP